MLAQVDGPFEGLAAVVAGEGVPVAVRVLVHAQVVLAHERLLAQQTHERPVFGVHGADVRRKSLRFPRKQVEQRTLEHL